MLLPHDPADWLSFVVRIQWTFLSLLLCSATAFVVSYLDPFRGKRIFVLFLVLGAVILMVDVIRTVTGREMLLTLLGSEDDYIAEQAYRKLEGQAQATWLLPRINDKKEESNVRFYLTRMLATNPENLESRADIIGRINSDPITPRFFGLNAFNADVKTIPAPFTTRDVALHYGPKSSR